MTKTEAGMTDDKLHVNSYFSVYMVAGLVLLVVGAIVFLPSVLGYWDTLDDRESMREKAEEMGLEEIPGVTLNETLAFFFALAIFGSALLIPGVVLVTVAILKGNKKKGI